MADFLHISKDLKVHDGFREKMEAALYAADKHAMVFGQYIEDKDSLISAAGKYLPDYTIVDWVNDDAVMIKQSVTEIFGIPDITSGDRQKALDDYYSKINKFGYSAIVAHKALYSGTADYTGITGNGSHTDTETIPLLNFLPALDNNYYPKKRILFECTNLPDLHCGTTEVMLYLFEAFCRLYKDKYDIYMLTGRNAAAFHKLEEKYVNILYPDTITGTYHIGYVPAQMTNYEQQILLNKHCLRIVSQILDIIMLRSFRYVQFAPRVNIDLSVRFCDGFTFISKFSKDDFTAFYKNENFVAGTDRLKVIYITNARENPESFEHKLPFENYYLIAGSHMEHKGIAETISALRGIKNNFIVIGGRKSGYISKNIYGYKSGLLDESCMKALYKRCRAVIFPSLYEGFGLPVLSAISEGKCVIVNNNALNHELQELYPDRKEQFIYFNKFEDIKNILEEKEKNFQLSTLNSQLKTKSWDTVAQELEEFLGYILEKEIDIDRLIERLWTYRHVRDKSALRQLSNYSLKSLLRFAVKENIKHRHPKIFGFVKKVRRKV